MRSRLFHKLFAHLRATAHDVDVAYFGRRHADALQVEVLGCGFSHVRLDAVNARRAAGHFETYLAVALLYVGYGEVDSLSGPRFERRCGG